MCNLSHRASLLTSVKMFIAARVLCSTASRRISTVGIVMFICSVSLPQGFLEFHSRLTQMTLQLSRRHLALESFRHLSGAAFRVLCVSEEKRGAKAAWLALPHLRLAVSITGSSGDVAVPILALQGFPGGRRNTSS